MFESPNIRENYVALCNLMRRDNLDSVMQQACVLAAQCYEAEAAFLFLTNASGLSLDLRFGSIIGNTNWAPTRYAVSIDPTQFERCAFVQCALTKETLAFSRYKTGYDLSRFTQLLLANPTLEHLLLAPLLRRDGSMLGIMVLLGQDILLETKTNAHCKLSMHAIAAQITDQLKLSDLVRREQDLKKSYRQADRDRVILQRSLREKLENILPGGSATAVKLRNDILRMSKTSGHLLLFGRHGTGPNIPARALHDLSPNRNGALLRIDATHLDSNSIVPELFGYKRGAIQGVASARKGLVKQASAGSLLIENTEKLTEVSQNILLDLIDQQNFRPIGSERNEPLNTRLMIHCDPENADASFLLKLKARLGLQTLHLPDLQHNLQDLGPLLEALMKKYNALHQKNLQLDPTVCSQLQLHPDLLARNDLEAMFAAAFKKQDIQSVVQINDLFLGDVREEAVPLDQSSSFHERVTFYEQQLLKDALKRCDFNRSAAAQYLQMPKRTLADKCKKYDL